MVALPHDGKVLLISLCRPLACCLVAVAGLFCCVPQSLAQYPGSRGPAEQAPWSRYQYRPLYPSDQRQQPSRQQPAQPYAGQYPPFSPHQAQPTRPQAMNPARMMPQSQPQTRAAPKVELELEIARRLLYVQQSTVLSLTITSNTALKTATPELPGLNNAIYKQLESPATVVRGQEHITRFRYAFTPLASGEMDLPPISVSGESNQGVRYSVSSELPIRLSILPIEATDSAWLPLHGLTFNAHIDHSQQAETGKPITLTTMISAVGTTGAQLPSLEQQLQNTEDFKIYRENVETEGRISNDGSFLLGMRTETYTLIPTHGGKARIPGLRIVWWNVDAGESELASVPIRQIVVQGPDFDPNSTDTEQFSSGLKMLWIPLSVVLLLSAGFWGLAWLRRKPFVAMIEEEFLIGVATANKAVQSSMRLLSPRRRLESVRRWFLNLFPVSWRVRYCLSRHAQDNLPISWASNLRGMLRANLEIDTGHSMLETGRQIQDLLSIGPNENIDQLMHTLDQHLYGNEEKLDFPDWREKLLSSIKRAKRIRSRRERTQRKLLPELNPNRVS